MADELKNAAPGKKRAWLTTIGMAVGAVLVAVIAGLLTFQFLLAPRLAGSADGEDGIQDRIPPMAVTITFEQQVATLVMPPNTNVPASLLLYQVALECANPETLAVVDRLRPRFVDMIRETHANKTREEVDDPLVVSSIKKQILQRANSILNRALAQPDDRIRITDVFHMQWTVQDQ